MKRNRKPDLEKYIPEPNTGCWLWVGRNLPKGYGRVVVKGKDVLAHRAMWMATRGPIPPGVNVCHKCDVTSCVNPDHLFLGTQAENMADMRAKGRGSTPPRTDCRGSKQGAAKLTDADVIAIRASAQMQKILAAEYGVSPVQISRIKRRTRWAHIP